MKNNKLFSIVIIFLITTLIVLFSVSPKGAYAAEEKNNVYCPLCIHRDDDDPLYKKERQFYQKIHIIKKVFGNSIDEVALAASVLHRYSGVDVAYEKEYDDDFNANDYENTWKGFLGVKSVKGEIGLTDTEKSQVEGNEKIALLTTAAIVMVDSNHFGSYSDVCFKDALAGEHLVNNDGQSGLMGTFINGIICDLDSLPSIPNPAEYIVNFFNGDSFIVTNQSAKNRLVNTKKVCDDGYIGGLYSGVSKIKDESRKNAVKKVYANQIIDLSNYYKRLYGSGVEEYSSSCVASLPGSTGAFASWRQFDSKWGSIPLGNSDVSLKRAGCLVTSISMQIARSGTRIGTLPSGFSEFNPGAFVTSLNENGGFAGGGNYAWTGFQSIAPNWGIGDFVSLGTGSNSELARAISNELSSGYGSENHQKFLVLQIHHAKSAQHWVAVNGVENGVVTIFDPASDGTTLDDNYDNWVVDGYRVMFAKDVSNGQIGSTNNNSCIGDSGDGEIQIPSEYGNGGYTVTEIDRFNWVEPSREVFDKWLAAGGQYDDGVAVLDGRYLIACTETFGNVGESVDFYLENGTKIPALIFDTKNPNDPGCNKWGHDNGTNVIEFEVSSNAFRNQYGGNNPGNNGWHMEWAGSRVASATNLGKGAAPVSSSTTASSSKGAYCKNGVGYGISTSGSSGNKIADLAVRVAPVASPDDFKSAPNAYPWTPPATGAGYPEYLDFERIMYETIGKYPSHDPNNPNSTGDGYNNCAYASCAQAAGAIIRATVDPDFTTGCPCDEMEYLQKNTEKWQLAGEVTPDQDRASVCKPGDLLITCGEAIGSCATGSGHVMIYVGNELARTKFPNTEADVFEAAYGGSYALYPKLSDRKGDDRTYKIYRPTGRGDFYYPFIDIDSVLSG